MRGVNKVILVGNLGKDPEVRYMPNGTAVTNFSIATSETWKDQQGQQQERTEWHSIVIYRRLAEIAGEYLKKGSKVYLEGKLQTQKWQDIHTGQDRYKTEVNVLEMQMLDSRGQQGNNHQNFQQAPQQNAYQAAPQRNGYGQAPAHKPSPQHQTNGQQQAYRGDKPKQPAYAPRPQQTPRPAPVPQQAQQNYTPDLDDSWDDDIPF